MNANRAHVFIDPDRLTAPDGLASFGLRHNSVTSLVIPRPIGWFGAVRPPRDAESPVNPECPVVKIFDLPRDERSGSADPLVVGRIAGVNVRALIADGEPSTRDALPPGAG